MPVVGVVANLLDASSESCAALERTLAPDASWTLGERCGSRLPLVLEAATRQDGDEKLEALSRLAEIGSIEVVYVDFEDALASDSGEGEEQAWT